MAIFAISLCESENGKSYINTNYEFDSNQQCIEEVQEYFNSTNPVEVGTNEVGQTTFKIQLEENQIGYGVLQQ